MGEAWTAASRGGSGALSSQVSAPEGQAAVADVPNYATGGVTFVYTEVEDVI